MNFNFELILFYITLIAGVLGLFDILFLAPKRKRSGKKMPVISEYARSFFPVLLLVFVLRSFLFEPFRIPSGSLEPTLLMGDFVLVNKFDYGLRLPVIHEKLTSNGTPQRGDILVFRWPANPSIYFIKRVVGIPGDRISYVNKELTVNGEKAPQTFVKNTSAESEDGSNWQAIENQENLLGIKHDIILNTDRHGSDYKNIVVPPGVYFVMGDNRDYSADSRYWGFVPDKNVVGKAVLIFMSWDGVNKTIRWHRLGSMIH